MTTIGPLELLLVGVIALIVFGPRRLPEIARSFGRTMAELRRQANAVRAEFEEGLSLEPEDEKPAPPAAAEGDPEPPAPTGDAAAPSPDPAREE